MENIDLSRDQMCDFPLVLHSPHLVQCSALPTNFTLLMLVVTTIDGELHGEAQYQMLHSLIQSLRPLCVISIPNWSFKSENVCLNWCYKWADKSEPNAGLTAKPILLITMLYCVSAPQRISAFWGRSINLFLPDISMSSTMLGT